MNSISNIELQEVFNKRKLLGLIIVQIEQFLRILKTLKKNIKKISEF